GRLPGGAVDLPDVAESDGVGGIGIAAGGGGGDGLVGGRAGRSDADGGAGCAVDDRHGCARQRGAGEAAVADGHDDPDEVAPIAVAGGGEVERAGRGTTDVG